MSLARTLLSLVPDDRVQAALAAYDRWAPVIAENAAAVQVARAELEATGNPIAAARAFAAATSTPLDDAAAAELVDGVRAALRALVVVTDVAGRVAVAASDERIDAARRVVVDVGFWCARQSHQLRTWLDQPEVE